MANWQGTVFSIFVAVGLIAAVADTVDSGVGVVQVIQLEVTDDVPVDAANLRPIIDLIHDYSPRSIIEVLERMENGDVPGSLFIMVRHPNQTSLNSTSEHIRASREWVNALADLEFAGHSVAMTDTLFVRTPD